VLVTGATGFVGTYLLELLTKNYPEKTLIGWHLKDSPISSSKLASSSSNNVLGSVQWHKVDLLNQSSLRESLSKIRPQEIYHCAAAATVHGSWKNTSAALKTNVYGTHLLLDTVREVSPDSKVLIPGSALVYKPSANALHETSPLEPVSPYGVSKLGQELIAKHFVREGLSVIITRSFTHFGPRQAATYAISSFAKQIVQIEKGLTPATINVGNLEAKRDLTDVRDTVAAYEHLMKKGKPGRIYNVCSGRAYSIREVLNLLRGETNKNISIHVDQTRLRPNDNELLLGDLSRIKTEIGWKPKISLKDALKNLLDYWRTTL
tara:strand:- start:2248 stop:3207 length:960 start_codon:yes stop_codon:yes gene_type:complete